MNDGKTPGILAGLKSGLSKTRSILLTDIRDLITPESTESTALLEELENRLLLADVGVESTERMVDTLRQAIRRQRVKSAGDVLEILHKQMVSMLEPCESPLEIQKPGPQVILVVGVNGAGKTTTIGKLANIYRKTNRVLLVAGDTFRAAAIEQLESWGRRNDVPVVAGSQGGDAAALIYDGLVESRNQAAEVVIADTAGRLQNKNNLIDELKKIRRIIGKFDPGIPVETLLVLDAGNGQNALVQARQFNAEVGITGIALTKLDGTAKGGILFALADQLDIPFRFIGTGEGIDDIAPFNAGNFVTALLDQEK